MASSGRPPRRLAAVRPARRPVAVRPARRPVAVRPADGCGTARLVAVRPAADRQQPPAARTVGRRSAPHQAVAIQSRTLVRPAGRPAVPVASHPARPLPIPPQRPEPGRPRYPQRGHEQTWPAAGAPPSRPSGEQQPWVGSPVAQPRAGGSLLRSPGDRVDWTGADAVAPAEPESVHRGHRPPSQRVDGSAPTRDGSVARHTDGRGMRRESMEWPPRRDPSLHEAPPRHGGSLPAPLRPDARGVEARPSAEEGWPSVDRPALPAGPSDGPVRAPGDTGRIDTGRIDTGRIDTGRIDTGGRCGYADPVAHRFRPASHRRRPDGLPSGSAVPAGARAAPPCRRDAGNRRLVGDGGPGRTTQPTRGRHASPDVDDLHGGDVSGGFTNTGRLGTATPSGSASPTYARAMSRPAIEPTSTLKVATRPPNDFAHDTAVPRVVEPATAVPIKGLETAAADGDALTATAAKLSHHQQRRVIIALVVVALLLLGGFGVSRVLGRGHHDTRTTAAPNSTAASGSAATPSPPASPSDMPTTRSGHVHACDHDLGRPREGRNRSDVPRRHGKGRGDGPRRRGRQRVRG